VQLKDKNSSAFSISNPGQFLSSRAIARRNRYQIAIDATDLPVNASYINTISGLAGVTVINASKWLNQVCVRVSDANAVAALQNLSFVQNVKAIASRPLGNELNPNKWRAPNLPIPPPASQRPQQPQDVFSYGAAYRQIHMHRGEFLHNLGFSGQGMQIAIMDAGFNNYLTVPAFDSIRTNNQILVTWDYVANKASVNEEHPHGMYCLSTIAANQPGSFVGTAPHSNFYLYRSEDVASEYPVEEHNFLVAAEAADSAGADVFSISLGYNRYDNSSLSYTYADMNGRTSMMAKGCTIAARKGIMVFAAAGNDGNGSWHYITTPADADSIATVGAVGTNRIVAGFSGYGPSADGRVKPDLVAVGSGTVVANTFGSTPGSGSGTSFATPLLAGISTCLWQAFPEVSNMQLLQTLRKVSDQFLQPDDRSGYGLPDMKKAFVQLEQLTYKRSIAAINDQCKMQYQWRAKAAKGMRFVVERKIDTALRYQPVDTFLINEGAFAMREIQFEEALAEFQTPIALQYRIRMELANDTSFILDSATVQYLQDCSTTLEDSYHIQPNPVREELKVAAIRTKAGSLTLSIYTADGKRIADVNAQLLPGTGYLRLPMRQNASGWYVAVLYEGGKRIWSERFFKF
jgi:hypothetical protein